MNAAAYRTRARPALPSCTGCGGTLRRASMCGQCTLVLAGEQREGMYLGGKVSALLAACVAPALASGMESFVVLAVAAWLCGPFVWALRRKRLGPRSQARALGVALAHGICVVAVLVGVPIAWTLVLAG